MGETTGFTHPKAGSPGEEARILLQCTSFFPSSIFDKTSHNSLFCLFFMKV